MLWSHVEKYYASIRKVLRIDACCEAIDRIMLSLKNNINCIAHYMFKYVTTFVFFGDFIAETANSGIKNGSIRVSINMNINTSGMTQVKILQNQNENKLRCMGIRIFLLQYLTLFSTFSFVISKCKVYGYKHSSKFIVVRQFDQRVSNFIR